MGNKTYVCSIPIVATAIILLQPWLFLQCTNVVWYILNIIDTVPYDQRVNGYYNTPLHEQWQPVTEEHTVYDVKVKYGSIPLSFTNGILMRIGPNPKYPRSTSYHTFEGDGMIHSIKFNPNNNTVHYSNSWMRTPKLNKEIYYEQAIYNFALNDIINFFETNNYIKLIKVLFASFVSKFKYSPFSLYRNDIKDDRFWTCANTDILKWNNKLYATCEGSVFFEFEYDISSNSPFTSVGFTDLNNSWNRFPFIAHCKIDINSNNLLVSGHHPMGNNEFGVGIIDTHHNLLGYQIYKLNHAQMFHDMSQTKDFIVVYDYNAYMGQDMIDQHKTFLYFNTTQKSRIGIINKKQLLSGKNDIQWFDIEPCLIFHMANAWQSVNHKNEIEINLIGPRMKQFDFNAFGNINSSDRDDKGNRYKHVNNPNIYEYKLNLNTNKIVYEHNINDKYMVEFPILHPLFEGLEVEYIYFTFYSMDEYLPIGIIKYHVKKKQIIGQIDYGNNRSGSAQAQFVPINDEIEDDGYLVNIIYDKNKQSSSVQIWDAKTMHNKPITIIDLPYKIPAGFHAKFL